MDNTGGSNNNTATTQTATSDYVIRYVEFKPVEKQNYGFDEFPEDIPQFWTEYEKKKIAGKEYPVNWKSLQSMHSDWVKILIKVENPDSIDTRLSIEQNISGYLNFNTSLHFCKCLKIRTLAKLLFVDYLADYQYIRCL